MTPHDFLRPREATVTGHRNARLNQEIQLLRFRRQCRGRAGLGHRSTETAVRSGNCSSGVSAPERAQGTAGRSPQTPVLFAEIPVSCLPVSGCPRRHVLMGPKRRR